MSEIFEFRVGELVRVKICGCYLSGAKGFVQEADYDKGLFSVAINSQIIQIEGVYLEVVPLDKPLGEGKKERK